jgi:hypothetical protein
MSSIDQQFVEFVVKSLVSKPDEVKVERRIDEKGVLLELTVDPEDLGRVIGKRGATAQSLRTLLRALGTKNDARYNLKIVDNGVGGVSHQAAVAPDSDQAPAANPSSDDDDTDQKPADDEAGVPAETEEAESEIEPERDSEPEERESVVSKTRKELEDLDDLDV